MRGPRDHKQRLRGLRAYSGGLDITATRGIPLTGRRPIAWHRRPHSALPGDIFIVPRRGIPEALGRCILAEAIAFDGPPLFLSPPIVDASLRRSVDDLRDTWHYDGPFADLAPRLHAQAYL